MIAKHVPKFLIFPPVALVFEFDLKQRDLAGDLGVNRG